MLFYMVHGMLAAVGLIALSAGHPDSTVITSWAFMVLFTFISLLIFRGEL